MKQPALSELESTVLSLNMSKNIFSKYPLDQLNLTTKAQAYEHHKFIKYENKSWVVVPAKKKVKK